MNIIEAMVGLMQFRHRSAAPHQIGPGERTVDSSARAIEKSRRQAAARKALGRWHPMHSISDKRPFDVCGVYLTDAHAQRRFQRAVARMQRLGLDASSIPNHIKRNAEAARQQQPR